MAVFWTLSLIVSYLQLFSRSFFSCKSESFARCSPSRWPPTSAATSTTTAISKPIYIITGNIWFGCCSSLCSFEGRLLRYSCSVDPGAVKTNIMREVPSCLSQIALFVLKLLGLLQSPENGICSILDAALAPPDISGVYFFGGNGRTINSSALSYNTKLSKELWTTTGDLFLELQLASKDTLLE